MGRAEPHSPVSQTPEHRELSHFAFLQSEWPAFFETAAKAESLVHPDARAACFYARRGLEPVMQWLYNHDPALKLPYQDTLSALRRQKGPPRPSLVVD